MKIVTFLLALFKRWWAAGISMNQLFLIWLVWCEILMGLVASGITQALRLTDIAEFAIYLIPGARVTHTKFSLEYAQTFLGLAWLSSPLLVVLMARVRRYSMLPVKIRTDPTQGLIIAFMLLIAFGGIASPFLDVSTGIRLQWMNASPYMFAISGCIVTALPWMAIFMWKEWLLEVFLQNTKKG